METPRHPSFPPQRYGPHYATVGLVLVLVSIPVDLLLPLLAEHAPSVQTQTDLRQFAGTGLFALLGGIVLCLMGFLSRRDPSHHTVAAVGLVAAVVWIGLAFSLSLAL
jgi:peptidoglycan/LPS O-acetylase OafA/YrhL